MEELNRQIIDLQGALDAQGMMLRRLMDSMARTQQHRHGDERNGFNGSAMSSELDIRAHANSTGLRPSWEGARGKGKGKADDVDMSQAVDGEERNEDGRRGL